MTKANETDINEKVVEQARFHIRHHGGKSVSQWCVGIEDIGSDRDDSAGNHPARFEMNSEDEAKLTMSRLLELGLTADDEYGAEPTILFIYRQG